MNYKEIPVSSNFNSTSVAIYLINKNGKIDKIWLDFLFSTTIISTQEIILQYYNILSTCNNA
jgi:hypothetical protein